MMHREVDYRLEAETTIRFRDMLKSDHRFIVPRIFPEYSTSHVMATSYEPGLSVTSEAVQELSLARRKSFSQILFGVVPERNVCLERNAD